MIATSRRDSVSLRTAHEEDVSPPGLSRGVPDTRAIVFRARIPAADRRDRHQARAIGPIRVFLERKTPCFTAGACTEVVEVPRVS